MIGASLAGACWLTGGISYWIGNAIGYWLSQPVNLFLVCWQLLHLEKFNIALMALPVIFALLTQHARRKLRETGG
jgi:biotin transporter BioY